MGISLSGILSTGLSLVKSATSSFSKSFSSPGALSVSRSSLTMGSLSPTTSPSLTSVQSGLSKLFSSSGASELTAPSTTYFGDVTSLRGMGSRYGGTAVETNNSRTILGAGNTYGNFPSAYDGISLTGGSFNGLTTRPSTSSVSVSRSIEDLIPGITLPGGIKIPGLGLGIGGVTGIGAGVGGSIKLPVAGMATRFTGATGSVAMAGDTGTTNQPTLVAPRPDPILSNLNSTLKATGLSFAAGLAARAMGMVTSIGNGRDKFQRTYNWELLLPGIGILTPEVMGRYIQEVSFSEYSIDDVTKLRYGGEQRGHAGTFSIPRMTVKFIKPVPDLVYTYLMLWKDMIVDSNGFFAAKANYALPGYLLMFDTTGQQSGSYKIVNMFPLKFPTQNMSYAESSIVSYTVDFNVDRLETLS